MRNIEHFAMLWREYFDTPLPISIMVEVAKVGKPEYLIEISTIAVIAE